LFNYQGKRFDIKDVMGQFEKDANGMIMLQTTKDGLCDNLGRRCNEKGYLCDKSGNIIDNKGTQLWKKTDLKSGEFPKIFPFTKFNISRVTGEFDLDAKGNVMLLKDSNGGFADKKGRKVNMRGYLIDAQGNVIDIRGNPMFDRCVLETNGDIPPVFRSGVLRAETGSELSQMMDDLQKDGETSMDSKMGDTPANYNMANQRFDNDGDDEPIDEDEGGEHMAPSDYGDEQDDVGSQVQQRKIKRKPKKKKPKLTTIEFLQPTTREKSMAGAYGGQAVGSIRRPGIKYEKERLEGSKKFRVQTADEEKVRAQLNQLIKSQSNATALKLGTAGSNDGINVNSRGQALMSGTGKRSESRSGLK
jgi:hypothetical protein